MGQHPTVAADGMGQRRTGAADGAGQRRTGAADGAARPVTTAMPRRGLLLLLVAGAMRPALAAGATETVAATDVTGTVAAAQATGAVVATHAGDAIDAAGAVVAARATEAAHAGDATHAAEAALERGREQRDLAQLEEARASYLEGIAQLTAEFGANSPVLIEPYAELARIHLLGEQPLEAIALLETARSVSQRHAGLFNLDQIPLLDEIGRAYLLMGDTRQAQAVQRERLNVALRRFGETDPRTVPFRNHLADYYDRSRMRLAARREYEAVLDIQRDAFGQQDGRLLTVLARLTAIDIRLGDIRSARRQMMRVLAAATDATPRQRAEALAVLGDWERVHRRIEAAQDYYRQAWAALRDEQPALAEAFFATPKFIDFIPPASAVDRLPDAGDHAWGFIEARFDVSATGSAANIAITAADPPARMDALYLRRLAEARYRPRLVNGEPAPASGVAYRHEFRYRADKRADAGVGARPAERTGPAGRE